MSKKYATTPLHLRVRSWLRRRWGTSLNHHTVYNVTVKECAEALRTDDLETVQWEFDRAQNQGIFFLVQDGVYRIAK